MANVSGVKERVQTFLTSVGPVQLDSDGDFSVPAGSTRVYVRVLEHPGGEATIVSVFSIVLRDVPLTPALYEYIAVEGDYIFGHLKLSKADDGQTGVVMMGHRLLGDFLDKDELLYAVFGVAGTADEIDDSLKAKFGGRLFSE